MGLELHSNQREAINRYLKILNQRYGEQISRVILFGSVARGSASPESDIDLLIVTKDGDKTLRDEISMAGFDIMIDADVILSPVVMDHETFEWHKKYRDPFFNRIERDGVELWTKKPEFLLRIRLDRAREDLETAKELFSLGR